MSKAICSVDNCPVASRKRGWCERHYQRWRNHGDPVAGIKDKNVIRGTNEERFWARVDKSGSNGCWIWTGWRTEKGYGGFTLHSPEGNWTRRAHRYAYELLVGAIPDGILIDHRCHNRPCVNPEHLRPVTPKQNEENRAGATRRSKSGVRGVYWHKAEKKWHAQVGHHGRNVHVGFFDDLRAAEQAVIAKRNELHTHNDIDRAAWSCTPRERAQMEGIEG